MEISLKDRIVSDMKEAMKSKQQKRVETLRMLLADMKNEEVGGSEKKELSDNEIVAVLRRAIKKRRDAIEQFKRGNRYDMVKEEEKEIAYIEPYLPPSLSRDELEAIIRGAIDEAGATSMKEMGRVMKIVMSKVEGRADGKTVSDMVKDMLKSLQ